MIEKNILNGFLDIRQNIALQIYTSFKHICKPDSKGKMYSL